MKRKIFPCVTTLGLLAGVLLNIHLYNDSRLTNGYLALSQMTWWENTVNISATILVFSNIVVAAFDAFRKDRMAWGWFNLLVWPVSYIYIWRKFLETDKQV